jgi:hypothetical protein
MRIDSDWSIVGSAPDMDDVSTSPRRSVLRQVCNTLHHTRTHTYNPQRMHTHHNARIRRVGRHPILRQLDGKVVRLTRERGAALDGLRAVTRVKQQTAVT